MTGRPRRARWFGALGSPGRPFGTAPGRKDGLSVEAATSLGCGAGPAWPTNEPSISVHAGTEGVVCVRTQPGERFESWFRAAAAALLLLSHVGWITTRRGIP